VFDLTADLGEDDHFNLVRQSNVRLPLKFADALPETISVVAYAEFENVIEVDRDRNVIFDRFWGMSTEEIDRILRYRVRDFDGVFSVDTLSDKPRLLVCNTDASDKPGRHWICMHFEAGRGEYFDSFGWRPTANFKRYLNRHCSSWTFNRRQSV